MDEGIAEGGGGMAAPRRVMTKMVMRIERRVKTKAKARRMSSVWGSSAAKRD